MSIHPTALISAGARIAEDVTIGPYCVIDDGVTIGRGCVLKTSPSARRLRTEAIREKRVLCISALGPSCVKT